MLHSQVLSLREKSLAIIAGALLLLLAIFGYSHVAAEAEASALLAQDAQPTATGTPATPSATDPREAENQTNNVRDQVNYAKNLRREIEDIKRDTKGTVNTSDAEANLTKFDACLAARQAEIGSTGSQTFWDNMRTCQDISTLIEDALRDTLRPLRDCGNYTKNLTDRKREFSSNIEKQLKDIKRNVKDTTALDIQIAALKDLLTRWEQAIAACNASNSQDVDGFRQDADDAFRDAYDALNEANEQSNQARRLTENQRDYEKNYKRQYEKDMSRELKNFEKEFAKLQKANLVTADAQAAYDNVKKIYADLGAYIASMQTALTAGDMDAFDDVRNEFNTYQRDFWDILNESRQTVNQQQQAKDVLKDIVQREKELQKMTKEYERATKQAGGVGCEDSKALLFQYVEVVAQAKQAAAVDPQSWWNDYQQQLNEIQNEFWNLQQQVQQVGDTARWMKDIERELLNREKDFKNMSRNKQFDAEALAKLREILSQMKTAVSEAKNTLSADPDKARDLLQSIDDLRMQWDESSRSVFERKQIEFEIGKQKADLKWTIEEINKMAASGRISSEEKASCLAFAEQVLADFDRVLAGEIENPEEHFGGTEERALQACPAFEKLNRVNPDPSVNAGYYKEFVKENVAGVDQDAAVAMLEKVSQDVVAKVLQRLMSDPTTVQSLLQLAGKDKTASTMESMANFYDDSTQRLLVAKKAEIMSLNQQIEQLSAQVQITKDKLAELQAVQNQITNYNFYGNAGDQIRTDIEKFIADAQAKGLSKDQIRARVDEFKAKAAAAIVQSKQAKVDAGIIPFTDTDDNEWYTKYVAPLAKLGIVKGKGGGKFDPGSSVTVAELVTMAFRVSGDPEVGGNVNSALCGGKFAGQWSNKFLAWAESRGLSVVSKCTDVNRPALRWEVAQTLGELAVGGKLPTSSESCFGDVRTGDQPVNSVVCWARDHGVMSGSNGKANAYGNVNRGEAATMVKQAAEKLFGIDFGNNVAQPGSPENPAQVEEEYVPAE